MSGSWMSRSSLVGLALAGSLVMAGCGDEAVTKPGRAPMAFAIPTDFSLPEAAALALPGDTLNVLFSPFPLAGTVTLSSKQTPLLILGNKDRPSLSILTSDEPILRFESPQAGTRVAEMGFSGGYPAIEVEGAGRLSVEDSRFSGGEVQVYGTGSGLRVDVSGCVMRNAGLFSIEMGPGSAVAAAANTIDGAGDCGIFLSNATATVNTCIIWRSSNFGIACSGTGSLGPGSGCNDIHLSGVDPYLGCLEPAGDFHLDPLFCDADNGNYFLQFGSPCDSINSGCDAIVGALDVACDAP